MQGRVQDQVQTVVTGWGVERRGGPAWGETQSAWLGCRIGVQAWGTDGGAEQAWVFSWCEGLEVSHRCLQCGESRL